MKSVTLPRRIGKKSRPEYRFYVYNYAGKKDTKRKGAWEN